MKKTELLTNKKVKSDFLPNLPNLPNRSSLVRRSKQLNLFDPIMTEFGGSLLVGKKKLKRILTTKKPIHMVLKGNNESSGPLFKHSKLLNREIKRWAKKFQIKIFNFAIEKAHIHFTIKISSRQNYNKFIRALTGRIAQLLNFKFTLRPFTKILEWGRQFKNVIRYVVQNKEEALGLRSYKVRSWQKQQSAERLQLWIEQTAMECSVVKSYPTPQWSDP